MFQKLFKYAVKNISRNTFLSISSVIILTLLMFFINILIVLQDVSIRIISSVNERLTISLYLSDEYNKNSVEVIDLQNDINTAIPWIVTTYKSKEEVLEDIGRTDPDLVSILERQNPLPETITIENIPLSQYENLNTIIENKMFLLSDTDEESLSNYFSTYSKQFERIRDLIGVLNTLQIGLYVIIVTFLVSIAVIVYSIIWNFIYYYRDEIYITRLVWGSKLFIYGPFSLQWMIYVFIAFVISSALFFILLSNLRYIFGFLEFSDVYTWNIFSVLLLEAVVFLIIGWLSWFFSSRRYLQKK